MFIRCDDKEAQDDREWMNVLREWMDGAMDRLDLHQWVRLFPDVYQLRRYLRVYRRVLRSAHRRQPHEYDVLSLFAPRADPALSGAGAAFDAPWSPLDMGRHWVLRELVRLEVIEPADHLVGDCWVPNQQVIDFLVSLGMPTLEQASNADKARAIAKFMDERLGACHSTLYRCFDIPLRYVHRRGGLRRELGLET